jgi:FAD-dependent urate hydroxylase
VLADLPLGGPQPDGTTTTTIRRADLYAALRAEATRRGIEIAYEKRLTDVVDGNDGVTARFDDGSTVHGDVLIGADGLNSRTRAVLNPGAAEPRYLGLLNAGGLTTTPIAADVDRTPGVVSMAFGRRAFFGWTAAPDGTIWWFANPPQKQPMRRGDWTPASWRAHLLELFAGDAIPAAAIIAATADVLGPWNTYDLPDVPVWRSGRTVLVGDAAHAASPSSGQGASMAIEDAVTLGRCLGQQPEIEGGRPEIEGGRPEIEGGRPEIKKALAEYERARRARVEKVVAYGKRSGSAKTAGPVGAAIRDAMLPLFMKMLHRKGDPQSWILDYKI